MPLAAAASPSTSCSCTWTLPAPHAPSRRSPRRKSTGGARSMSRQVDTWRNFLESEAHFPPSSFLCQSLLGHVVLTNRTSPSPFLPEFLASSPYSYTTLLTICSLGYLLSLPLSLSFSASPSLSLSLSLPHPHSERPQVHPRRDQSDGATNARSQCSGHYHREDRAL